MRWGVEKKTDREGEMLMWCGSGKAADPFGCAYHLGDPPCPSHLLLISPQGQYPLHPQGRVRGPGCLHTKHRQEAAPECPPGVEQLCL